jgi:uncharacterized membrane protein YraQ (UPF0718 family)
MTELIENTLDLALLSAPWLLFGLVVAGLIHAWLPMNLVGRSLGGTGPGAVIRAALIGAPLPLCSCGTLPAAFSLRRSGASRASTTSFLIATPETGVDSVALSWVLLGPFLALLRPVAAVISAVSAGLLVGRTEQPDMPVAKPEISLAVQVDPEGCAGDSCCCGTESAEESDRPEGFFRRTFDGLRYAFTDLLDDLMLWLMAGILVAAAVVTLVPPDLLAGWGRGLPAMLLILLVSVPMYVCATASTPIALAMLHAGVSPGTVLVFLLAGPASNLGSLALVRQELGTPALKAYLVGVGGVSVLLGLLLDGAIAMFRLDALSGIAAVGGEEPELPFLLSFSSLLILLVTGIRPLRRFLVRGKGSDGSGGCCG